MPDFRLRAGLACAALLGVAGCTPPSFDRVFADGSAAPRERQQPSAAAEAASRSSDPKVLFRPESASDGGEALDPVIDEGTGRLIGQPSPRDDGSVVRNEAGEISLNVVDADIREVARLVLEDGLGANYVIDPAVSGSITVRTSRPVPADDVLPLLNSVLNANGAALIEQDGLFRIVTLDQAVAAGGRPDTRLTLEAGERGSGVLVAPLRFADAAEIAELLQPFVAERGALQIDAQRNTLLLSGAADQIATLNELIGMFDVDWMAGMSFGFYPLDSVLPSELAPELDEIFGRDVEREGGDVVRFLPIDRLNALVVITAQPDYLRRAQTWIERLDKVGEGSDEQIYVYPVQNGRAADLASVLGELFDIRSTAIGPELLLAPGLEPIELGSPFALDEPEAEDERDGRPFAGERRRTDERGSFGGRGRFDDRPPPGQRELTEGREDDPTKIVADEGSNALLIRAVPKIYKKIEKALLELDTAPLQVLLEATIAEVTLRDELRYGIQWFFNSGDGDILFSDDEFGDVEPRFPGFAGILSSGDVRVVIDALDDVSDVQVISSPQILVLDNQTAQLEVGDEVPIIVQQAEGFEDDSRQINTVEQRQTGVILDVTPRVNANGLVVLDIIQEVSDVVETITSGIDSPTIAQRRVGTTVAVDTDQTVALGGLIQDDVSRGRLGIPVLSRLPLIGWLFGSTFDRTERTELLILITPRVLTNSDEAVAATEELRQRVAAVVPLEARIGRPFGEPGSDRGLDAERTSRAPDGQDRFFMVQLASVPSEAAAAEAWRRYESEHGALLASLRPRFEPYEIDGRSGYSVRAGPIATFDAADDLCERLRADGANCLVIEKRQRPAENG